MPESPTIVPPSSGRQSLALKPPSPASLADGRVHAVLPRDSSDVRFVIPGSRRAKVGIVPTTEINFHKTPNFFMDPAILENYYKESQERRKTEIAARANHEAETSNA